MLLLLFCDVFVVVVASVVVVVVLVVVGGGSGDCGGGEGGDGGGGGGDGDGGECRTILTSSTATSRCSRRCYHRERSLEEGRGVDRPSAVGGCSCSGRRAKKLALSLFIR